MVDPLSPYLMKGSTNRFDYRGDIVRDEAIEPVVEIFQCRGNAEYRGAPRMLNVSRHHPMAKNDKGFVDYALREKKYRLGFVASGDHNSMGVGLACVWVKEISRRGILEALRARRCFATTGDQIVVDFRVNGVWGETAKAGSAMNMTFKVDAMDDLARVEILRNSRVVHTFEPVSTSQHTAGEWRIQIRATTKACCITTPASRKRTIHELPIAAAAGG